ncbi:hypothetical protein [Streptomyces narbonensis]|uniref:hypothetical protein n=1 Tax=Streptomyces narbonensis TaxID=67333 RepID=UPI00167BD4FA|nr:hypothetical protein [Streptomyces narbonensis]GGW11037.1 hypothetical protein GCM10010230_63520 [Streptomyces narbonensis]
MNEEPMKRARTAPATHTANVHRSAESAESAETLDHELARLRRRRRIRLAAGLAAGAAVVAGGLFWLSGGLQAWLHDRALDSACDGALATDPVRELVGGAEVTAETRTGRDFWQCRVSEADDVDEEDGRIDLRVTVSDARDRFATFEADATDAPLGHGWTGGFAFDPDRERRGQATASVLLDCGGARGGGLIAEARARIDRADFGHPEARTDLTAVLTRTATAYARHQGCEVTEGAPVRKVGASVNAWDHEPFDSVSGSCAGIVDPRTATRWGVRTAVETAPGPKPVEGCTLGGLRGAPLYTFTASYGPALDRIARDRLEELSDRRAGDAPDGRYVLWADCRGGADRAAYVVAPIGGTLGRTSHLALDHQGLRTALSAFAERSAKAHDCTVTP